MLKMMMMGSFLLVNNQQQQLPQLNDMGLPQL